MLPKIGADFDHEGVYFYQAFNNSIADYAVANQRFGGKDFKPVRMTWIKPSFAWVLYRSGYAAKHNQGEREGLLLGLGAKDVGSTKSEETS